MGNEGVRLISFIIPCFGSEKTLESVVGRVCQTMAPLSYEYEIILVNDCSPDKVGEVIERLAEENPRITGVFLARNFGQHAALLAGMRQGKGDYFICLDDDGQTSPEEAPKLIAALEAGYDAAYARYGKKMHSSFRNFGSYLNELMLRVLLGKPKELQVTSYFAAKRFIVQNIICYEGSYPYVIGLLLRATRNIANVDVAHQARLQGRSGYTLVKLISLWMNGFTAFSIIPLRISTVIGIVFACSGFLYGIYTVIKKFLNPNVPMGFSSMMTAIVFIGGMVMMMLGIIGEYVGRIYLGMNRAPQYVVRNIIEHKES